MYHLEVKCINWIHFILIFLRTKNVGFFCFFLLITNAKHPISVNNKCFWAVGFQTLWKGTAFFLLSSSDVRSNIFKNMKQDSNYNTSDIFFFFGENNTSNIRHEKHVWDAFCLHNPKFKHQHLAWLSSMGLNCCFDPKQKKREKKNSYSSKKQNIIITRQLQI